MGRFDKIPRTAIPGKEIRNHKSRKIIFKTRLFFISFSDSRYSNRKKSKKGPSPLLQGPSPSSLLHLQPSTYQPTTTSPTTTTDRRWLVYDQRTRTIPDYYFTLFSNLVYPPCYPKSILVGWPVPSTSSLDHWLVDVDHSLLFWPDLEV